MEEFTLLKVTLLHEHLSRFLNRTNCTKSRKASHLCFLEQLLRWVSIVVSISISNGTIALLRIIET